MMISPTESQSLITLDDVRPPRRAAR